MMLVMLADDDSPVSVQSAGRFLLNCIHCPGVKVPCMVPMLMTFMVEVLVGAVAGLLPHQ